MLPRKTRKQLVGKAMENAYQREAEYEYRELARQLNRRWRTGQAKPLSVQSSKNTHPPVAQFTGNSVMVCLMTLRDNKKR